jgi:4'-phosphopantetheinyl transferase EntD
LPEWNISVSHTLDIGGWVAVPRLYSVGFDIEMRQRLKREVLERIASPAEIAAAPDPVFLWAAKEACFKALAGQGQPAAISDIAIQGWVPQFSLLSYSSQSTRGKGWVGTDTTRIYALFAI